MGFGIIYSTDFHWSCSSQPHSHLPGICLVLVHRLAVTSLARRYEYELERKQGDLWHLEIDQPLETATMQLD
jgi:hypothetical protein